MAAACGFEGWLKQHKRVAELLDKDDWVSVWIALAIFTVLVSFAASGSTPGASAARIYRLTCVCCTHIVYRASAGTHISRPVTWANALSLQSRD